MIRFRPSQTLYAAILALLPLPALAQNWALDGIDAVAYGQQGQAVPGRSDIATKWHGQFWYFSTEENRAAFEANPKAYTPGLGGLCVVALSEGRPEPGNPRHFIMVGQRAYLVKSDAAREKFMKDPEGVMQQADAVWSRIGK